MLKKTLSYKFNILNTMIFIENEIYFKLNEKCQCKT